MDTSQVEDEIKRKTEAKRKRCYHRVISGLKRGGRVRFLTLTSSDAAPSDIQRSWRCLYMRCLRRSLIVGYIKVPEQADDGRKHLHILFRGSYIDYRWIKAQWQEIHRSEVIDIRQVRLRKNPKLIAGYMAKYMSKATAGRYSWSWGWVWKGFCRDWRNLKSYWWKNIYQEGKVTFANCIASWDMWLAGVYEVDRTLLAQACETPSITPECIFRFSHTLSPSTP